MTSFAYKAKDKTGNTVSGIVDCTDTREAASAVREMGLLPMDIRPLRHQGTKSPGFGLAVVRGLVHPVWTGVSLQTLAMFYSQMAILLAAGMSLSESLLSVAARSRGIMRGIILEAADEVNRGNTFSTVLARYPHIFRPLHLSMIRAGEASGLIQPMLERLASYLDYELQIRRNIAKALFYPIIIGIFIVLIPRVPILVLNGPKAFALSLWQWATTSLVWLIVVLVLLKLVFQFKPTRLIWDFVKIVPPIIGPIARKIAVSRFSRALAMLYAAGMPLGEAVATSAEASANLYIASRLTAARSAVESGSSIVEAMQSTGVLPSLVVDLMATGEKSGSVDVALNKAAEYLEGEADLALQKLPVVLFVLAICAAGVVVFMMVLNFYTGYVAGITKTTN